MKKGMTSNFELSSSLETQASPVKKQTAKRSTKVYGELDKAQRLTPLEEEIQLWKKAVQNDQQSEAQGIEVEWLNPLPSTFPQRCLKKLAPKIFKELSKSRPKKRRVRKYKYFDF